MLKYFCWKDEKGYFCGQKLVSLGAVNSLRRAVADRQHFATIQTYDKDGDVLFSPLYADLDHINPDVALADARYIVHLISEMTNLIPDIYFSGNKGFHLIIPYKIEGSLGHWISRYFFEYLSKDLPSLDRKVYRDKAMFRLPNSPASKPGYFKVKLTKTELMKLTMDQIREIGTKPRDQVINECDMAQINDEFLAVIEDGKRNLPVYKSEHIERLSGSMREEMTFCIQSMLSRPADEGERNRICQLLARFMRKCGTSIEDSLELMYKHEHWKTYEHDERGVSKVFRSIWQSRREPMIGCKNGRDSDLMKSHCHQLCWFNERRMQIRFGRADHPDGWILPSVSSPAATVQPANGAGVFPQAPAAAAPVSAQ